MAGIFGLFDFTKEGPGVDPDAPPSPRTVVFFQVLSRKFSKLIKTNLLFALFNIPALAAMLLAVMFLLPFEISDDVVYDLFFRIAMGFVLVCIPVITFGPAQAGLTYILRNFSREEHAFIWSDFKDSFKKNFKQSLAISAVDLVIVIVFGFAINFYLNFPKESLITSVAGGVAIIALIFFVIMHIYIYPILITFNLKIRYIYKNAFIFSLVGFIPNLLIITLCVALILLTFFFNQYIGILFYILITNSLIGLILNFHAWPKIKKYMVDKLQDNKAENDEEKDNEAEANKPVDSGEAN